MLLLSALNFIPGCKKPDNLGEDIIVLEDDKLNILFTDTLTVTAYSVLEDSVSTSKLKYNLLGSHYDPVFGTTTASFYTQLRLSENNVNFGTNPVCDSVILTLRYTGFYGDTSAQQTIRAYEVDETMYPDSTYYSNDSLNLVPVEIGVQNVVFRPEDTIYYNNLPVESHLRFYLNKSFGEKIIAKSGQTELSDNENFQKFIKGIFVTADKAVNDGGYAYFDLMSPLSILSIYYHNDTDTLVYKFAINEFCSYFSTFNHYGYADADAGFRAQVIMGDTALGNQKLYIQSLGGVKTFFRFPTLKNLTKDGPIAVHNAQLLINVSQGSDMGFYQPVYGLAVVKLDSAGNKKFIEDYYEGSAFYGGDYHSTDKYYSFNINRYIQNIADGREKQYGLNLVAKGASIYGNRLVFDGPRSNGRKFRLKLTYTRVY